jgi:hypothetical protein
MRTVQRPIIVVIVIVVIVRFSPPIGLTFTLCTTKKGQPFMIEVK